MTDEKELTRAVEGLASTYGEAARLLVVAERERVLGLIEAEIRHIARHDDFSRMWVLCRRIRDGEPRGGAGEPVATGED